jgi:hypothetical protein
VRPRQSITPWIVGAVLIVAALLFVLRGREPSDFGALSSPSAFPVPNVRRVDSLQDLLRTTDDPLSVGDPRASDAAPAEAPPADGDR